jgi:hypothetical protein
MNKQHTYNIIVDILVAVLTVTVLCTVFIVNRDYVYSMVAGKYFWFYGSAALFSITAIPVFVIKCRKRLIVMS